MTCDNCLQHVYLLMHHWIKISKPVIIIYSETFPAFSTLLFSPHRWSHHTCGHCMYRILLCGNIGGHLCILCVVYSSKVSISSFPPPSSSSISSIHLCTIRVQGCWHRGKENGGKDQCSGVHGTRQQCCIWNCSIEHSSSEQYSTQTS